MIQASKYTHMYVAKADSHLDAFHQQRGPRLVHAQALALVTHLLQLAVLEPRALTSRIT